LRPKRRYAQRQRPQKCGGISSHDSASGNRVLKIG
jgi:hypothetical protein